LSWYCFIVLQRLACLSFIITFENVRLFLWYFVMCYGGNFWIRAGSFLLCFGCYGKSFVVFCHRFLECMNRLSRFIFSFLRFFVLITHGFWIWRLFDGVFISLLIIQILFRGVYYLPYRAGYTYCPDIFQLKILWVLAFECSLPLNRVPIMVSPLSFLSLGFLDIAWYNIYLYISLFFF